jgi:hypothetical protein
MTCSGKSVMDLVMEDGLKEEQGTDAIKSLIIEAAWKQDIAPPR